MYYTARGLASQHPCQIGTYTYNAPKKTAVYAYSAGLGGIHSNIAPFSLLFATAAAAAVVMVVVYDARQRGQKAGPAWRQRALIAVSMASRRELVIQRDENFLFVCLFVCIQKECVWVC